MINIKNGEQYFPEVKKLILEYTDALNRDLSFQHLEEELEHLEKRYSKPYGEILVAISDEGTVMGCVAYHAYDNKLCEMKRLYIKPEYRGHKVGYHLVKAIIELAQRAGYTTMVLDTLKPMKSAIALYKRFGFEECTPYYNNPYDDAVYMRKTL